jgi:hypothetical protein
MVVQINMRRLGNSSSARARYLWLPISLRIFLAILMSNTVDLVSSRKTGIATDRAPERLKSWSSGDVVSYKIKHVHQWYPLDPSPLKMWILLDPTCHEWTNTTECHDAYTVYRHRKTSPRIDVCQNQTCKLTIYLLLFWTPDISYSSANQNGGCRSKSPGKKTGNNYSLNILRPIMQFTRD